MRKRPQCECGHIDSAHVGYDGKCYVCLCHLFQPMEKTEVRQQRELFCEKELKKLRAALEAEPDLDYDSRVILLRKFAESLKEAIDLGYQVEFSMVYPARLLEIICNPYEYSKNIIKAGEALANFLGVGRSHERDHEQMDNNDRRLLEAYEKRKEKLLMLRKSE